MTESSKEQVTEPALSKHLTNRINWLTKLDLAIAKHPEEPLDRRLQSFFRKNKNLGSKDRRFYSSAVYGRQRHWGWLKDVEPIKALCIGYHLEGAQPMPEWLKQHALPEPWPFNDWESKLKWVESALGPVEFKALRPAFWPKLTPESWQALLARTPIWIRVAKQGEAFLEFLEKRGVGYYPHENRPEMIALEKSVALHEFGAFKEGAVEPQDLNSAAVGWIADPKAGERWCDLCAGAGGKMLHMAHLMGDVGEILAVDVRIDALKQALERSDRAGYNNLKFQQVHPGENPDGLFDGVLVDAPCSSSGTIGKNPEILWRLTELEVVEYAARQKALLAQAAKLVKPSGKLIYATCSIFDAENQSVVDAFLADHSDFAFEAFPHPFKTEAVEQSLQLLPPDSVGIGMFIARFRRD